ncbi:unnamed protein product [Penicillium camemberti]|uniref:Str. FM013 n=1 Tax=Penicillium camemberti (strain FM 013) TaxID=1429867 RepID=A0A0G4P5S5_PENC3|nr:unnamed protein product [Penicillium camemberti]
MSFVHLVLSLSLGHTINDLKKAESMSGQTDIGNAPAIFRETIKRIPSLLAYFENCKQYLDTTTVMTMEEELPPSAISFLEICEDNAARVNEIFSAVVGSPNAAAQYRKVARGARLEDLMKKILTNAIEMSNTTQISVISSVTEVGKLHRDLRSFMEMPASLPEKEN